jgi:hypothetical protein
MENAEFEAGRLATLRPRLFAHLGEMAYERWRTAHDQYKPVVDEAAERLAHEYQSALHRLVSVFREAAVIDERSGEINAMAPAGTAERLRKVELLARNLADFGTATPSITKNVVLSDWDHSDRTAWPI